ncbi:MAG TPA: amidohydrolase family protein [Bacilli bacterium]|nr:amidohydrolase family protein [Bacilli bacterium]
MKTAIINAKIYDFETYVPNGYIVFGTTIEQVGPMREFVDDNYHIVDAKGQLMVPGLVCGHTHIYSTFARGLSVPFNPKNFQDILDQMWWKLDRHLDQEAVYYSGLVAASSFALHGVTSIIDHHASGKQIRGTLHKLKTAIDEVGLRAAYAFETSDRFPLADAIDENIDFMDTYQDDKTKGLFGMHASLSLSDESLAKIKAKIGHRPIHIHIAESQLDQDIALAKYGKRVIKRLDDFGLINPGSIMVHCIHLDDDELDIIKKRGAIIAINATSNMNNAVGLPDVLKFIELGIPVIIGNDGIARSMASEYLSLYFAMHHRYASPTKFQLSHLLKLINDTYDYVGKLFGIKLGKIRPGYAADFMLVPYVPATPISADNGFGHLFFGLFDALLPQEVYIGGKHIVASGKLLSDSVSMKTAVAPTIAQRIWNDIHKGD